MKSEQALFLEVAAGLLFVVTGFILWWWSTHLVWIQIYPPPLEKIIIETTGEMRPISTPTVLLEGVFCDGSAHGGCDRTCFCFWREGWLKRVK